MRAALRCFPAVTARRRGTVSRLGAAPVCGSPESGTREDTRAEKGTRMKSQKPDPEGVDAYIASFPAPVRERLTTLRLLIHAAAPDAVEKLSYAMPAYFQGGNLLYYAAFKNHISIFPGVETVIAFRSKIEKYPTSKGTIQIPHSDPLPLKLIEEIVRFRVESNRNKRKAK